MFHHVHSQARYLTRLDSAERSCLTCSPLGCPQPVELKNQSRVAADRLEYHGCVLGTKLTPRGEAEIPKRGAIMSRRQREITRLLRAVLSDLPKGSSVPDSEMFGQALSNLEFFVAAVLRTKYHEWVEESLDGVWALDAKKSNENEAKILGLCMIITSQRYTPIYLKLQVHATEDKIVLFDCKLGEKGSQGMEATSSRHLDSLEERIRGFDGDARSIQWVYEIGFDCRTSP